MRIVMKQAWVEMCQAQYELELAKFRFGSVASLKFDCLIQTGVFAIVNNQILSLVKCCINKCCRNRCCMDKFCMDKCLLATCQQSRVVPQT